MKDFETKALHKESPTLINLISMYRDESERVYTFVGLWKKKQDTGIQN